MRRTKEDAEKTKQTILDAALKVFFDRGVTRSTMMEVANAAGVTRGAIYWHFKDKFDIYVTLYETITMKYSVRPEDYADKTYTSLLDFKNDIIRLFQSFESDIQYHMFIQIMYSRMEYIDEMGPIVDNEKKKQKTMLIAFERALTDLQNKGKVNKSINCKNYSIILFTFIDGIFDSWGIDETLFDNDCNVYDLLNDLFSNLEP